MTLTATAYALILTAEEPKPLKNNSELLHAAHCFILYTQEVRSYAD